MRVISLCFLYGNVTIKLESICENAIKESNINNAQKYPNKIIDFKNSTSIKKG